MAAFMDKPLDYTCMPFGCLHQQGSDEVSSQQVCANITFMTPTKADQ